MVIGSTVGRWLHLPWLHIESYRDQCISCGRCNKACPMGLDVKQMVSEVVRKSEKDTWRHGRMKKIIVYYSLEGNTEYIADKLSGN